MQVTVEDLVQKDIGGKVIVFQTENGYVLGALLNDELAIEKLYAITRREKTKPFTVLVGTIEDAYSLVKHPKRIRPYAQYYWPGDATLMTKKETVVNDVVSRGRNTVHVLMISDSIARRITHHFGPMVVSHLRGSKHETVSSYKDALVFENVSDYVVKGDNLQTRTPFLFDVDNNQTLPEEI